MNTNMKVKYEPPIIRIIQVEVEKGFAVSEGEVTVGKSTDELHFLNLTNVMDGKSAW